MKDINKSQQDYWRKKITMYKEDLKTIGSETSEHKAMRYKKIASIYSELQEVSILDVGAGFGDYYGYINENFNSKKITYQGIEITPEFCEVARKKYPGINIFYLNILEDEIHGTFDFVQMSGLFHQHGGTPILNWTDFEKK